MCKYKLAALIMFFLLLFLINLTFGPIFVNSEGILQSEESYGVNTLFCKSPTK